MTCLHASLLLTQVPYVIRGCLLSDSSSGLGRTTEDSLGSEWMRSPLMLSYVISQAGVHSSFRHEPLETTVCPSADGKRIWKAEGGRGCDPALPKEVRQCTSWEYAEEGST